ncbi:NAD-dependent epimerase/dehydratase family protein [Bacteroides fragilis]
MKITLIGASGFVGTRLIELLKQNNYFLQNVDKQQSRFHSEITVIANVLDKNNLVTLLDNTDVVILLAAEHRDDVTPTSLYYDVNVGGMRNTLEAMEANGVKRIIFTSSVAVYGLNKKKSD